MNHHRPILAITVVSVLLISACGSDDDTNSPTEPVTTEPAVTEPETTPPQAAAIPATTSAPTTTGAPVVEAASIESGDEGPTPEITREEAEALQAAIRAAAAAVDPVAFRTALGESGAFVGVDGSRYSGDELEGMLNAEWARGVTYGHPTELVPVPRGFTYTVDVTYADGTTTELGLELARNDDGGFDVFQFAPLVRDVLAATPDETGLDEVEARAIAEGVLGTYEDEEWTRAADLLGPDGAFVEAGLIVPAKDVPAFFASFTMIEQIDVIGPGVPAFGGFAFPVRETHGDGSANESEVIVTTDAGGAIRLVWLMPGQLEWLMANS